MTFISASKAYTWGEYLALFINNKENISGE